MTVQKDTEAPPDAGKWLDHLDDATALAVMLDDQAEATTAIRQSLGQIERAAAAITKRMAEDDTARIIYAGAGASIRIAVQDGVELLPTFNWPRERVAYLVAGGNKALIESVEDAEDDEAAARQMVDDLTLSANDVGHRYCCQWADVLYLYCAT
jgi:N-acetylmuramic acid 6-phosphate etherase